MELADKWIHPTKFTGNYPDWAGYTWLDWAKEAGCPHPGDDYNFGYGDQDLGQDVLNCANGKVFHVSEKTTGYGKMAIVKHSLGYNLKRFLKETYGIETDYLYTLYAHLKDIIVKVGDDVSVNQIIGHVGKSGTKWAHLHFEMYSLWKDLAHTSYRFYPIGWEKEKIAENWLPPYKFIEAVRNIESYDNYLGKPKEYWLQVEKDRIELLRQLSEKDNEFLKFVEPIKKQVEELQKEIQQLEKESANYTSNIEDIEASCKNKVENLEKKLESKQDEVDKLKIRITEILAEQSNKLKVGEIVIMFLEKLKNKIGGDNNENN